MSSHLARMLFLALAAATMFTVSSASADSPLIDQGRAALTRGDADAAIVLLEKAVAQAPKNAEAHYALANAYGAKAQEGGMLGGAKFGGKALAEDEKAVALDPKYVEPRYSLVQMYASAPAMMGGSTEKALEQAKETSASLKTIQNSMFYEADLADRLRARGVLRTFNKVDKIGEAKFANNRR